MKFETQGSRIGLYLVLTLALSCIFYALILTSGHVGGGRGLYVTGLMWCPAISALLTCRIAGLDYSILGWNWGETRWELTAFLVPLGYATVAYLIIWTTGLGVFGNKEFEAGLAKAFGWASAPSFVVIAVYFVLNGIFGMAGSVATALGEELGWRGFLAPHLDRKFGFTGGVLVTGAIWTLWHTPVLLFADYNMGTQWWFSLPCFALLVMSISFPLAWLRLRSRSVWPAAILHASHNLFIQSFYTPLTSPSGKITPYAIDEFGFVLPLVAVVVAIWFWRHRRSVTSIPA